MLIGMFIHQHLSAVSTLRTSSAQLQLLPLTAARIMVYASRLVTLVRTGCFPKHLPRANILSCRLPRRVGHPYIWSTCRNRSFLSDLVHILR